MTRPARSAWPITSLVRAAQSIRPLPAPGLHRVPGHVDKADLSVIIRAVTLYLARNADLDEDSLEKSGKAIAAICRSYLLHERSTRHANEDPS